MENPYVDLCLHAQAVRRDYEGIRSPLVPAIGVAASLYAHQLANVQRVLTDVRIRHLLADEVGLGKSVQALMVLNALRYQRADLQALIVVPDRLVTQWRDEIMTRAHTAPFGEADKGDDAQYIRLAWESQLRMKDASGNFQFALSDIDPERYNVLIVDEIHRLRTDIQDFIVRVAADFEHILILTATPAFQLVERHAQIFALLEPERTELSRWRIATGEQGIAEQLSVKEDISKWPKWAASAVVDDFIEKDLVAKASGGQDDIVATALTCCAYRRIIRTRRIDYCGVLPRRRHRPIVVEPLGAEADRQSLMWQYFSYLGDLSREFDPVLLAKRVILSPPSLEQRVDFLRRQGHDRAGLLEKVKPLVHRSNGDSRADALVDLLAEIWIQAPQERVLVAAQDNLTVDYLYDLVQKRLPIVGPIYQRVPLVAARIRQGMMTEAVEDLGGFGNETSVNLEAFQRGVAQVLFAPEAAQVGLNLQCARVLVLYSVPWRPEEVEQWIGRLDRIGNAAAFSNEGDARSIDVYTIAQRGLVDEKVVTVLQRFRVFEKSVNLDGDHLGEVATFIEKAALISKEGSWQKLEAATEAMAMQDEEQEFDSALRMHLPWTVSSAKDLRRWLESIPPAPPVLKNNSIHSHSGPRAWDRAFEGMLNLLRKVGEYHIRRNSDPETGVQFNTLWYQFGDFGLNGLREVKSKIVFSFGADPHQVHNPQHAHAFITRRGDISSPPRRSVSMEFNNQVFLRHLRFLSFGDALHDELVRGWLPKSNFSTKFDVVLPPDHAFWIHGIQGLYLLRLTVLDAADALSRSNAITQTHQIVTRAAIRSNDERLPELIRPFIKATICAIEADVRWIRSLLTASMVFNVRRWDSGSWVKAEVDEVAELFNPMAHSGKGVPKAYRLHLKENEMEDVKDELSRQRQEDTRTARSAWSNRFPDFEQALATRLAVIEAEGLDAISLASANLCRAEEALRVIREKGNRGQITRAENTRNAAADVMDMTHLFWSERTRWLKECSAHVRAIQPQVKMTALIRVRKFN
ncbi:RNA polymerase-associated protein RapA [anaerobic digester metagenome]